MASVPDASTSPITLINGVRGAQLAPNDRGLAYGDGLFETIAFIDHSPRHWSRHFARLQRGCLALHLECPAASVWHADLESIISSSSAARQVLKLILTRGGGRRGYAPTSGVPPTRIVQLAPWPESSPNTHGLRVIECATPLGLNPALAGVKHLNRLEQVLAAREIALAGADEGLMCDGSGRVLEATRSNVFVVINHALLTPPLTEAGVLGVMREVVMERAAQHGLRVLEQTLTLDDVVGADELWLTNALDGVRPVTDLIHRTDTRRTGTHRTGTRRFATTRGSALRAALIAAELAP